MSDLPDHVDLAPDGSIVRYYHGQVLLHAISTWCTSPGVGVEFTTVCGFNGSYVYGEGSWASTKRPQVPTCLWCITNRLCIGGQATLP